MAAGGRLPLVCVASVCKGVGAAIKERCPEVCVQEIALVSNDHVSDEQKAVIREHEVLLTETPIASKMLDNPGNLKWIQSTFAGVETIMSEFKDKPPPTVLMTRMGHAYGQVMGEFVIGQIICWEKQFHAIREAQKQRKWVSEDQYTLIRPLTDLSIGILGVGEVGREVARMCECLGMTVWGMTRCPVTEATRCPYVKNYSLYSTGLEEVLSNCDYICNILPCTPQTTGLLNGGILRHCRNKKSIFINIGRGNVIDDEEIIKALRAGWIGGAILDVFKTEPLPTDSPLWMEPNIIINPHCSGFNLPGPTAEGFLINYERYRNGKELLWKYNFQQGY